MQLHAEILKVIKTGRTNVMVEIDQVASGVSLLSCFINNREMTLTNTADLNSRVSIERE